MIEGDSPQDAYDKFMELLGTEHEIWRDAASSEYINVYVNPFWTIDGARIVEEDELECDCLDKLQCDCEK